MFFTIYYESNFKIVIFFLMGGGGVLDNYKVGGITINKCTSYGPDKINL